MDLKRLTWTFPSLSPVFLAVTYSVRYPWGTAVHNSGLTSLRNRDTALASNSSSLAKGRNRGWIRTLLALYPVQASPEFHEIYAEVMSRCGGRGPSWTLRSLLHYFLPLCDGRDPKTCKLGVSFNQDCQKSLRHLTTFKNSNEGVVLT